MRAAVKKILYGRRGPPMEYFESIFGFAEADYAATREQLLAMATFEQHPSIPNKEKCTLTCKVVDERGTGKKTTHLHCGWFWDPSVSELRSLVKKELANKELQQRLDALKGRLGGRAHVSVANIVNDSRTLHIDGNYANATVQAASQFNYLEFASPGVTPEKGITCYVFDRTQGPACATACAAGTAYRNYLARVGGSTAATAGDEEHPRGQTRARQFNGLRETMDILGQHRKVVAGDPGDDPTETLVDFVDVRNGYVESDAKRLKELNTKILCSSPASPDDDAHLSADGVLPSSSSVREQMIAALRVGIQEDTQVTDADVHKVYTKRERENTWVKTQDPRFPDAAAPTTVTQVYCSALSVGYSRVSSATAGQGWEPLARVVLDGTYEATMLMGILQLCKDVTANPELASPAPILLTKVGGGVFGNDNEWIKGAMARSFAKMDEEYGVPLNAAIVHFGAVDNEYTDLARP